MWRRWVGPPTKSRTACRGHDLTQRGMPDPKKRVANGPLERVHLSCGIALQERAVVANLVESAHSAHTERMAPLTSGPAGRSVNWPVAAGGSAGFSRSGQVAVVGGVSVGVVGLLASRSGQIAAYRMTSRGSRSSKRYSPGLAPPPGASAVTRDPSWRWKTSWQYMSLMATESTPLNSMAASSRQGIEMARSMFLTTTRRCRQHRGPVRGRTATTTLQPKNSKE
jgi:hypothetical protein